jgi:aspartyl-tRNA(Asn)/glutamyl-tRNA(Gln) amidotransferase subunit C
MPADPLSPDAVRKVARLSRLALSEERVRQYQTQLASILTYMDRLRELDLTGVEPLTSAADTVNRLDEDTPGPTLPNDTLMRMAPDPAPPFIRVPKVLDEGGGA